MATERNTENIVRKHFEQFLEEINIEEQKSENPIIDKLLKTASKKGEGKGFPEFIITWKNNPNFLIVVECKLDTRKHESITGDKYCDFAVDGVKLYTAFLSKEYDVLGIAVSGQNLNELRVSHFLKLKGESTMVEIFGNDLLTPLDYINGYLTSEQKYRQDYDSLLKYSKQLNEELHSRKIKESQRSLLISGIMIALDDPTFNSTYQHNRSPKKLASALIRSITNQLEYANINESKIRNLEIAYSFINVHTSLTTEEGVLVNLIKEIDSKVKKFTRTHRYFDVLSDFYVEFLRKSNSDKQLGIVLTPPHITELFNLIAQTNKNSVIFDNCTGTAGFLISAMRIMIKDAAGNSEKEKNIKEKQLIGIEFQDDIFALACSNMYIQGEGRSNILSGSCFNEENASKAKSFNPNIGFLNPPYKSNKKKDREELEFILMNLDCLQQGGICVAIVPMQCALSQKGKILELKKLILSKHTLEAVMSMPDELFFNSNVGVVSCIMVFKAHIKHPMNKETYFGYWKNDGFVKRKTKGRVDAYLRWDNIKEYWIESYTNKKSIAGLSIMKHVTSKDEWSAEAYMETDYSAINDSHFEKTILDYSSFLYLNKMVVNCSNTSVNNNKVDLIIEAWRVFDLPFLFDIKGSKTTPLLELEEFGGGDYPYVTTQATNNGTDGFYNYSTEEGNVLTIDSAVLGHCSYQSKRFSASDHVEKLIPKFPMNKYTAMFLVTILNREKYRYNYGRKASQTRMKLERILLPVKDGLPDFKYMEDYIKSLAYSSSI